MMYSVKTVETDYERSLLVSLSKIFTNIVKEVNKDEK